MSRSVRPASAERGATPLPGARAAPQRAEEFLGGASREQTPSHRGHPGGADDEHRQADRQEVEEAQRGPSAPVQEVRQQEVGGPGDQRQVAAEAGGVDERQKEEAGARPGGGGGGRRPPGGGRPP